MYLNDFQPVTFEIILYLPEKCKIDRWSEIVRYYLDSYALALAENQSLYIGHIKALCTFDNHEFIKYNKFKVDIPSEISFQGGTSYERILITLNSLIYGVSQEESITALTSVSERLTKAFLIQTQIKAQEKNHEHQEHHHHHF